MKSKVLAILYDSFHDNGSVNYVVKQDVKRKQRIKTLLEYSYYKGRKFGKIYLSDNQKAAAIVLDPKKEKFTVWDIKLIFSVIGLRGLAKILKREKALKRFNPTKDFVYLWYVGVEKHDQGKGIGSRLMKEIFADLKGKAIHLQTSNPRNFNLYENLGFQLDGDYVLDDYHIKIYTLENK